MPGADRPILAASTLRPVRRRNLEDEVLVRLREAIRGGRYRPGDRLRQEDLASRLGVSRTPLRHALVQLEQEGLVEEGTQGFRVTLPEYRDVLDLFEICAAIEGVVARLAAERIDDRWLRRLEGAAGRDSARPAVRAGGDPSEFHDLVAAAAGNDAIVRLRPVALSMTRLATHDVVALSRADKAQSKAQHRAIIEALRRRDGAAAERLTRAHLLEGRRRLEASLRAQQDGSET
jgi:DNA-binding GntR family transcriptional regulator